MARPLASRELLWVTAAATAGWLALVGVLFQVVPGTERRPARRVHPVASHRAPRTPVWEGAPQVYAELDRRVRGLGPDQRARVARAILEESARADLAPLLVLAVIHVESRFDPRAVSPVGAVGLMQLMVPTLRGVLGPAAREDPFDPVVNVRAGVRYLGHLVDTFSSVELALVAYNAGPGAVRRHLQAGGIPERLRGYPRDVLRAAVRLWPARDAAPAPASPNLALAAAHRPPPPLAAAPGVLVAASGGPGAEPAAVPGARDAGEELLAAARVATAPTAPAAGGEPPRDGRRRAACIRAGVALRIVRGRPRAPDRAARAALQA